MARCRFEVTITTRPAGYDRATHWVGFGGGDGGGGSTPCNLLARQVACLSGMYLGC